MTVIVGLDVSHHQGAVDWRQVAAAGYRFAFCKATEGDGYVDPTHRQNVAAARAAGLLVGSYHYAKPAHSGPKAQARHLASQLGAMGAGRLPAVLDLEETGGQRAAELRGWAQEFLTELDRLTGRRSILYTGRAFWHDQLAQLSGRPLWIARYGSELGEATPTPVAFWQHTSKGHVPGIAGAVDLNRYYGTAAQLDALAGVKAPAPHVTKGEPMPPTIRQGDRGLHVRRLQALLLANGQLHDLADVDGIAGPRTMGAVHALQRRAHLHPGAADAHTWRVALGLAA